jgi:ligand-binding sensor domain-containing protein/AraC-like DNA-binding protein
MVEMDRQIYGTFRWARQLLAAAIIISLFWCPLLGLDPDKPIEQYLVDQWEIAEGIPFNTVLSIAQTPDGYLWLATYKGLVRFDGMKFLTIPFTNKGEIESLENTIPEILFVDKEGNLWIGSSAGLTLYQHQTSQFKTYTPADGITKDRIRTIKDDMKGNLWIGFFTSYLNRFSNREFTVFNASHGLGGKKINAIVEDRKGNLLFGTREKGVFVYRDGKFFKYPISGLDNAQIITMYEDRKGDLWIGTNNGLLRVTDKGTVRYTIQEGLSNDYITDIIEDSDQNLWAGTVKGLNRIKKREDSAIDVKSVLNPFSIVCLFEDREKSLWVGTDGSGIKRLKDGKFISYEPYTRLHTHLEEILLSLFEDRHGDTWIGTFNGKLLRCRGSDFVESMEFPAISGTGISSLAEDAAGNLWLGTLGNGVFQKKKERTLVQFTTRQGLADNVVTSIFRDSQDNLWFSTSDGVSRYRNGILESWKSRDGLAGKMVHNIYEDKMQNIWIATDKGVTVLKNGKMTKKSMEHFLQNVSVTCIYEDLSASDVSGSVYWMATHGAGLKRLTFKDRTAAVTSYTTADGMTTNFIFQFFEDPQENFWLMSDSGILRVSKRELNQYAQNIGGGGDKINCTSFGISDGMKSIEFNNAFSRNSALKKGNGEFWFTTKKGITIVNPTEIEVNKFPPPVVIEAVIFNQQPIAPRGINADAYVFKGITDFQFYFTAPTFLSPEKVKFKYQLEGADREWVFLPPDSERVAQYQNLKPGTYTFKVIASNNEGVWNRTGDSMTFTLKPFFYQTILFKIAIFLLLIALGAAGFYIYKKRPFEKQAKYKGSPLTPQFADECIKKLRYLMEIEKLYCDAELSLQALADKLSISTHLLSQILNEKLNQNFADFVNSYRIEEAKKILQEPRGAQQKITTVALEVGFNTLVAFYNAFKKYTNMTPAQYRKKVLNKK